MSQPKISKSKDNRPLKVYSFKAELSAEQIATITRWLNGLNRQFNEGLSALTEAEQLDWREEAWAERSGQFPSMAVRWRCSKAGLYSLVGVGVRTRKRDGAKYCVLAERRGKPLPDKSMAKEGRIAQLRAYAVDCRSEKNYSHAVVSPVPSIYRDGCIDTLKKAWKVYKDPKLPARRPQFKKQDRPVKSLINLNGKTTISVDQVGNNAWVKMPGLAPFKIKGYFKRFPCGLEYGKVALVQDGGEWFVQFSVRYTPSQVDRPNARRVGVDPGVKAVVATSDGHVIQPRRKPLKLRQRLKRLQRKQARQQKGSKSLLKTKAAIALIHARCRRQRKAFNAKIADWLGRFDVAFEGSRLGNMSRAAKPKPRPDGKGYERNGAKAKSGLNRELLDNGLGQIRQLTEARCKSRGHEFVKTADGDVRYSSRRCHCCGEMGKRISQEKFFCLNRGCRLHGVAQHADVNAAKNHAIAGYNLPREATPVQLGEVMPVESGATPAGQPGGRSRVAAPSKTSSTTPEPSKGQPLQGFDVCKGHANTPNGGKLHPESNTADARQESTLQTPKGKHGKGFTPDSRAIGNPASPAQTTTQEVLAICPGKRPPAKPLGCPPRRIAFSR
jgi:putative transposase